jgi:hypothetical protein
MTKHPGRRPVTFALAALTVTFLIDLALALPLGLGDVILSVRLAPRSSTHC